MNEDFLHYVWRYQLFATTNLKTTENNLISVIKKGMYNTNAGPDFKNAQIKIDNQLWAGNVEIHLKSSDWYAHHHEVDKNYDAVILHVVWEDDVPVFMKNNTKIPTLVLKDVVLPLTVKNYKNLFAAQPRWIFCENEIAAVDSFILNNWKERLFFERLERKSNEIKEFLNACNNDFEAVLFKMLAKNFGLKINGEAFLSLANSFNYLVLKKVQFNKNTLAALLFGQAGFLEDRVEEAYFTELKKEYRYLQHKYDLQPIDKKQFSFFRMRPSNFPTIRIAQLISLYHKNQNLFSKIIKVNNLEAFYDLFSVDVPMFWKTHYTFEKEAKSSPKKITKPFVDLLIINTIIPLKFLYQKNKKGACEDEILAIIKNIKPEKNSIISKFKTLKITSESAFETQSLLELKNNYCAKKRCLQCALGLTILKDEKK